MKTQLLTLLTCLLFCAGSTYGQELIIYENSKPEAYLVRHQEDALKQPVANFFLKKISQGNNKPLAQTEYVLVHDEFLRMTKLNATGYQVFGRLQGFRLNGDTQYRGFDISSTLLPSGVKYSMERVNAQGRVLETWDFASVAMSADPFVIANFKGTDSTGSFANSTLRIRDKSFYYGKTAKLPFTNLTTTIDEYYNAGPELDALYRELQTIDLADIDHLDEQESNLNALLQQTETFRQADYPQQLQLSVQNDPANFLSQFSEIDAFGKELRANLNATRANLHVLYYERGLAAMQASDRPAAVALFNRSLELDPNYTPAHLELARVSYQEGDLPAASSKLLALFKNFQLDPTTRSSAVTLANTVYQNDLGNADYAIKQARYADALVELDAAAALCQGIGPLACTGQLQTLRNSAQQGLYRDLLSQGSQLLQAGDLAAAETSAREAIALQASAPGAIADPTGAQNLLQQVMAGQYAELVTAGAALETSGDHRTALQRYQAAQDLEATYGFAPNAELPAMAKRTAKVIVLEDIATALQQAQNNRLREARETQNKLFALRKRYALEADPDVKLAYEGLQDAIFDQECTNAQAAYDQAVARAQGETQAKRFIEAVAAYDAALQVAAQNAPCGLDVTAAQEGKARIAAAASYQEQRNAVQTSIDRVMFREAIDGYLAAGAFHTENKLLEKFAISHADLFPFIQKSGRREFKRFGAEYFTNLEAYEKAIDLLREILDQGYKKGKLKALLVRIGAELAVRDHKEMPGANAKTKALSHTGGHKGLKKLYKAYVKQWKRL